MAGQAASMGPDAAAARKAAARIHHLVTSAGPSNAPGPTGSAVSPATVRGELEFRGVSFCYPARPDAPVLRDFNLRVRCCVVPALLLCR